MAKLEPIKGWNVIVIVNFNQRKKDMIRKANLLTQVRSYRLKSFGIEGFMLLCSFLWQVIWLIYKMELPRFASSLQT